MPTTLTGLLLSVVLLLPGFAYLVGKERNGTERRLSPFRETVAIVAASVTCELAVIAVFAIVRGLWPSATPDVGALIRGSGAYLRGSPTQPGHYRLVAAWGAGLLAAASALAYAATIPGVRRVAARVTGPYPHESTVSAWWILLNRWRTGRDVEIACILDDGSAIRGKLGSFNSAADDSPDPELVLRWPIRYRPPGGDQMNDYEVGAVCVAARRIVAMFVSYTGPDPGALTAPAESLSSEQGDPSSGQSTAAGTTSQYSCPQPDDL